jgi:hypothetical protein
MPSIKCLAIVTFGFVMCYGQSNKFNIPEIAGLEVTKEETIVLPTKAKVKTALAFKFNDGRIICGDKGNTLLSTDNGHTWLPYENGNMEKAMTNLRNGESLAISRNSHKKDNGKFSIAMLRSSDNWQTTQKEVAEIDIPHASFTVTGSGNRVDGFLFHHGLLELDNGDLIGSMYGNFEGDTELCAGYPTELNQRKYHTIVVFSKDAGKTWGDYVHVAYDKMLGRGIPDNHEMIGKSIPPSMANRISVVPAVTMEGFRESDLVKAANGDLLCIMRSGGRNPIEGVALFPTPLYCSRSEDNGQSWTPPMQIADRGVSPNAVTLDNGIIVCTYSRPGNWLIFSDDNGKSWKGAFQFADGRATNYIINSGPDSIQVFYEAEINDETKLLATYFTVKRK